MKNIRSIFALLLALSMTLALVACGGKDEKPADDKDQQQTEQNTEPQDEQKPAEDNTDAEKPADEGEKAPAEAAEFNGKLQAPFLVSTCGQSPGAVMVNMVAVQAGLTSSSINGLTAADLADHTDAKTLIITTGTSGKGMGAAGTDVKEEIARCTELAKAAKDAGMFVVCAHVEGMQRRADSADQSSIDAIIELADAILVIEESDSDGFFSDYATEHDMPIIKVKDSLGIAEYME